MARILLILAFQFVIFFFIFSFSTSLVTGEYEGFVKSLDEKHLGLKKQKFSHFHFYFHDTVSGHKPTAVAVVPSPFNTSTFFGQVSVIDDPLTLEPNMSSNLAGRAQGFYAATSQQQLSLLLVMNLVFTDGKYNGSTITVLGQNAVFNTVREMPVIGGSGMFRLARGYVQARTHTFDTKSGDAIVEYNAFVFHY